MSVGSCECVVLEYRGRPGYRLGSYLLDYGGKGFSEVGTSDPLHGTSALDLSQNVCILKSLQAVLMDIWSVDPLPELVVRVEGGNASLRERR